ncbi:MAG: phenylalanine--tRNA ligase subunit beta [Pseudomonadota bacterium]
MRVTWDWLKEFVETTHKPEEVAEMLTMSGLEVEAIFNRDGLTVFELGVTPNRSDCLSVQGVAREVAAVSKSKLVFPQVEILKGQKKMADFISIKVKSSQACPRYSARVIEGVKIKSSPEWLIKRLTACGLRPVNNVVDATNYVMWEMGQPLHAFDYKLLQGKQIVISQAEQPFIFETLDHEKRQIKSGDLLICDGEGAIALAGIMGGKNSEVSEDTTTLVLESAYFEPSGIRRTSKRLGLSSESSRRFERQIDPNQTVLALHRLTDLICEIAEGTPTADHIDLVKANFKSQKIKLKSSEILRILGIEVELADAKAILTSLGFKVGQQTAKTLDVEIPTFRPDVTRSIDLIEEIARVNGYDKIKETLPKFFMNPLHRPALSASIDKARQTMQGCGFSEAVLMGFDNIADQQIFVQLQKNPVKVANPLSSDLTIMRTSLVPGLLNVAKLNLNRQRSDIRIFSLQKIYHNLANRVEEKLHLAGLLIGSSLSQSWDLKATADFFDLKSSVEAVLKNSGCSKQVKWQATTDFDFLHPAQAAHLVINNKTVGFIGRLHPSLEQKLELEKACFIFELDFEILAGLSKEQKRFEPLSKFPFVERDLAILVDDEVKAEAVKEIIWQSEIPLLEEVRVFDVYKGKGIDAGKKSMAYAIKYASKERTLTDDEVNSAHDRIVKILEDKLGAILRT